MPNDVFDILMNNSQQANSLTKDRKTVDSVYLTLRADADCQVVCDGDFLFLLNANQIVKEKAPVGQHILQFISIDHPDICIEKIVDFPDPRLNYLVLVNEFNHLVDDLAKKERIVEDSPIDDNAQGGRG